MKRPKIIVRKRKQLDDSGHYRFYSIRDNNGMKISSIDLEKFYNIVTEKQLLKSIYDTWGKGEYLIFANAKGYFGFFTFWRGIIDERGYCFYKKEYDRKAVSEWDNILDMKDEDDASLMQNIKDEEIKKTKKKRYGFAPFLRPSGRRGQFHFWNEHVFEKTQEDDYDERGEDWGSPIKKTSDESWTPNVKKPEDWGANKEESIW